MIAGCRVGLDECRQGCLYCPDEDCEILRFSGFSRCDACSFGLLFGGKGSAAATAGSDRKGSARKVRSRTLGELHPPQLALRRALLSGMLVIFLRRATPVARERTPCLPLPVAVRRPAGGDARSCHALGRSGSTELAEVLARRRPCRRKKG